MKRIITGIAASALVLSLCVTGALAAGHGYGGGHHGTARTTWSQNTAGWTGVCGHHSAACGGYADADGDGICDNCGAGCGGYVDANGDGVCDNCGAARGWRYVDADGDGVCDNYGTGWHSGCGGHRC